MLAIKQNICLFQIFVLLTIFLRCGNLLADAEVPFTFKDVKFEADYKGDCETDAEITSVDGDIFIFGGSSISIRDGKATLWCYGAKHTWIGRLTYAGYIFDSDKDNPLQFVVDKDKGYVYLSGKGTVTSPDGSVVTLPIASQTDGGLSVNIDKEEWNAMPAGTKMYGANQKELIMKSDLASVTASLIIVNHEKEKVQFQLPAVLVGDDGSSLCVLRLRSITFGEVKQEIWSDQAFFIKTGQTCVVELMSTFKDYKELYEAQPLHINIPTNDMKLDLKPMPSWKSLCKKQEGESSQNRKEEDNTVIKLSLRKKGDSGKEELFVEVLKGSLRYQSGAGLKSCVPGDRDISWFVTKPGMRFIIDKKMQLAGTVYEPSTELVVAPDGTLQVVNSETEASSQEIATLASENEAEKATAELKVLSESPDAYDITKICELIKAGADVNVRNKYGVTPLWIASEYGHIEVVELLLEAGSDVNAARTTDGVTSLMISSQKGHIEVVKLLLEAGGDVNTAVRDGRTSLWSASAAGHTDVVKLLLKSGALVNAARKTNGATPLFMASLRGHNEIVKLLLEAKADVNAKAHTMVGFSPTGKTEMRSDTPLSVAKEGGHTQIIKLLKEYGAKD